MGWIIITVILAMLFWIAIAVRIVANRKLSDARAAERMQSTIDDARFTKAVATGAAAFLVVLWLVISGFYSLHNVGQREVAIVYNFSGTISGKRDPGTVIIKPWEHIKKENVGIQHDEWNFNEGNSAVSKDQQPVFALLAVNYRIDNQNVVDLYKRVGPSWKSIIIDSRVPQVFKEVTSGMATVAVTQQRPLLRARTRARLIQELRPYDIEVVDVFVRNLGFSKAYTQSIEAKQVQVQKAQQARAKVQEAAAIADQKIEAARGAAESNLVRARAERQANRLRQQSLTPLLVQQQAIEKLNPHVQMIICPPNSVCIPNSPVIPTQGGGGGQ